MNRTTRLKKPQIPELDKIIEFDEIGGRPYYGGHEMTSETRIPSFDEIRDETHSMVVAEATARDDADDALQAQIDVIVAASDVKDIVGTKADLEEYDTSTLGDNDIIKVLQDETQNDEMTYYRWHTSSEEFTLIGAEGPYYTKAAVNNLFEENAGKAKVLTVEDYNYPANNPTAVGLWLLEPGVYTPENSSVNVLAMVNTSIGAGTAIVGTTRSAFGKTDYVQIAVLNTAPGGATSPITVYAVSKSEPGSAMVTRSLTWQDVVDNLTSTETGKPLSAKQGKVLKDLVDSKQDALIAGNNISIASDGKTISAKDCETIVLYINNPLLAGNRVDFYSDAALTNHIVNDDLVNIVKSSKNLVLVYTEDDSDWTEVYNVYYRQYDYGTPALYALNLNNWFIRIALGDGPTYSSGGVVEAPFYNTGNPSWSGY